MLRNIFSYDNKLVQVLMKITDMAVLNVLYILCCLPVFTIGAAQAGLYSGMHRLMDKEDDRSCVRAFFKGFAVGFKHVTPVYLCFLVVFCLLAVLLLWLNFWADVGANSPPIWMCLVAMAILAVFYSGIGPFHASFNCTAKQMFRNLFCVTMAYPLRCIASAVLIYIPLVQLYVDINGFLSLIWIWLLLYYSIAFLVIHGLMKKPMEELKQIFLSENPTDS